MIWNLPKFIPVILMISSAFGSTPEARSAQTQSLVEGNTAFALDLYGQLKTGSGNLFFSPYSLSTALAMTYAGARGQTEQEMGRVLHFSLPQAELHPAFGGLARRMEQIGSRHLPVLDGEKWVGMLSMRDLLRVELSEQGDELKLLHEYIQQ